MGDEIKLWKNLQQQEMNSLDTYTVRHDRQYRKTDNAMEGHVEGRDLEEDVCSKLWMTWTEEITKRLKEKPQRRAISWAALKLSLDWAQ